jgi:hypothetical protein
MRCLSLVLLLSAAASFVNADEKDDAVAKEVKKFEGAWLRTVSTRDENNQPALVLQVDPASGNKTDMQESSLPARAVPLGTLHWRHDDRVYCVGFAADAKHP